MDIHGRNHKHNETAQKLALAVFGFELIQEEERNERGKKKKEMNLIVRIIFFIFRSKKFLKIKYN